MITTALCELVLSATQRSKIAQRVINGIDNKVTFTASDSVDVKPKQVNKRRYDTLASSPW